MHKSPHTFSQTDIALLQETHLSPQELNKLKQKWVSQVFSSGYNSKSRGVAVLIHKNISFQIEKTVTDPEGRFILLKAHLFNKPIIIINIYAPNENHLLFFNTISELLAKYNEGSAILCSDFDSVPQPSLDKSTHPSRNDIKISNGVTDLCKGAGLADGGDSPTVKKGTIHFIPMYIKAIPG